MEFEAKEPTEEFLRQIDIHELLPQQEPFVMIGTLVHLDEKATVAETVVREDNIFVDDGLFSASGLMENIAQTCAARIGFINKYILKKSFRLGLIGAVRNFEVLHLPHAGQKIITHVKVKEEVFGLTLAEGYIESEGEVLARAEIKIAAKGGKA